MVGEIKPLQLGLAGAVVLGALALFLGMSGTCGAVGQGFYGMTGLPGNGCSLEANVLRLGFGTIIGFNGGVAIALVYNYISNTTK
jgi:hypothetical protein